MMVVTGGTTDEPWRRRCRCGASYDVGTFCALASRHVLDEAEIASLVVRWPAGVVVDVRVCAACGHALARLDKRSEG